MRKTIDLPYVAKTYWFLRWGFLLGWLSIWVALIVNYSATINSLHREGWLINIGFLIFVCVLPLLGSITMFFTKTVFYETHIEYTSQLLIKRDYLYEDINKVETSNTGHIRITFVDKNSIKVWSGEVNLNHVLSILKSKNVDSQVIGHQAQRSV